MAAKKKGAPTLKALYAERTKLEKQSQDVRAAKIANAEAIAAAEQEQEAARMTGSAQTIGMAQEE